MTEKSKSVFRAVLSSPGRPETVMDVCGILCRSEQDLMKEIIEAFEKSNKDKN